jgi:hypothetical protein
VNRDKTRWQQAGTSQTPAAGFGCIYSPFDVITIDTRRRLGVLLFLQDRLDELEQLHRNSINERRRFLGDNDQKMLDQKANIAMIMNE